MLGEKITLNPGNYLSPDPAGASPTDVVRRGRLGPLLLVTVAVWMLAGCGGDGGDDAASTTTTVAETSTTATEATTSSISSTTEPRPVEEEVEEAYLRSTAVLADLLEQPDPSDERLAQMHVDPILGHLVSYLQELIDSGVVGRWAGGEPPPVEVISVEVDGSEAVVESCQIDNADTLDAESGEVLDDSVISSRVETTLRLIEGTWMVSDSSSTAEWLDGLGCDR